MLTLLSCTLQGKPYVVLGQSHGLFCFVAASSVLAAAHFTFSSVSSLSPSLLSVEQSQRQLVEAHTDSNFPQEWPTWCDVGSDEGAFAWLTLNYLLGFLGKEGADTMAAIDLGGGSVQEAFALTDAQAKTAPDPLYVTKLKGGGHTYSVYVHR